MGEVLDDLLGVDSLTSTRFTSNQHRLIFSVGQHSLVSSIGNGVQVGWHFSTLAALVGVDDVWGVYWQHFVGIDSDTEKTRVGIDQEFDVSGSQNIQDGTFIKISQVSHIFTLVILWRILFLDIINLDFGHFFIIKSLHNGHTAFFSTVPLTWSVTGIWIFWCWNPNWFWATDLFCHCDLRSHDFHAFLFGHPKILGRIAEH